MFVINEIKLCNVSHNTDYGRMIFIVQLGPGIKSTTKALYQSRTLNALWNHPPTHMPTENFLKDSRLLLRPRFGM